jgi:hypothetical protein
MNVRVLSNNAVMAQTRWYMCVLMRVNIDDGRYIEALEANDNHSHSRLTLIYIRR